MMNSNSVKPVNHLTLTNILIALSLAVISLVSLISVTHAGDLVVEVDYIKSDQGNVRIALFSNAKDFPKTFSSGQFISAKTGSVFFTFKDLPAGSYAVSAFHDINSNEKLDTNFIGKPVEPFGFSRDARGIFGPPSFEDAAIKIGESGTKIKISVK